METRSPLLAALMQSQDQIRRQTDLSNRTSLQASANSRILAASDDPLAASEANAIQARMDRIAVFQSNVTQVKARIDSGSNTLKTIGNLADQASNIASSADYSSTSSLQLAVSQVDSLLEQIVQAANFKSLNVPVLGGGAGIEPVIVTRDSLGKISSVTLAQTGEAGAVLVGEGGQTNPGAADGASILGPSTAGGKSLIDSVIALRNALGARDQAAVATSQTGITAGRTKAIEASGELGVQSQYLDQVGDILAQNGLDAQQRLSAIKDIDLAQATIDLQAQANQLRLTLAATTRMFDNSLLDFLR